jgi:TonB-dependent SusC/RagA subfamily outer membrane receptor
MKNTSLRLTQIISFTLFLFLYSSFAFSQRMIITGIVDDKDGTPVAGVYIFIDGKNTMHETLQDGSYRIRLRNTPEKIGFMHQAFGMQEFQVKGRHVINYTYPGQIAPTPGEQVNVGYGTVNKKDLTSSVSTVKEKDFANQNPTLLWETLAGKVPGLQVIRNGPSVRLLIRGVNSLNSSTDPLIIVDGMAIDDLNFINPHDVESIDVIKDGSAAIYGSRGSNGVIIITTKRGK